jgi:hypothetical protein
MKQGLSDVLLWFLSLCLVLEYFSTVLPNFYLWKQGLSDVLLFVIPSVFGLKSIFQQSYPISTYESRSWVMCCSFVIPFFVFGLRVFSTVLISTYKQGLMMCCSFVIPFFTFGLRDFFNSPTQFLPMKAGIEWCAALCVPFFVFGLRYFQQSYNFYLWSRLSDVLLFCDSFLCVWS